MIITASVGALVGLTRNLALKYAPSGVRVNCLLPGADPHGDDGRLL